MVVDGGEGERVVFDRYDLAGLSAATISVVDGEGEDFALAEVVVAERYLVECKLEGAWLWYWIGDWFEVFGFDRGATRLVVVVDSEGDVCDDIVFWSEEFACGVVADVEAGSGCVASEVFVGRGLEVVSPGFEVLNRVFLGEDGECVGWLAVVVWLPELFGGGAVDGVVAGGLVDGWFDGAEPVLVCLAGAEGFAVLV